MSTHTASAPTHILVSYPLELENPGKVGYFCCVEDIADGEWYCETSAATYEEARAECLAWALDKGCIVEGVTESSIRELYNQIRRIALDLSDDANVAETEAACERIEALCARIRRLETHDRNVAAYRIFDAMHGDEDC